MAKKQAGAILNRVIQARRLESSQLSSHEVDLSSQSIIKGKTLTSFLQSGPSAVSLVRFRLSVKPQNLLLSSRPLKRFRHLLSYVVYPIS